ncbi:hypothetical protein ABZT04_32400, partial [Streptomyces sp. NPDC005492]|uniref:hypothetical protein n=1 Tax=Streptomyces sp. NPDC005492 TaxID=3156883 RepID=UPI0033ACE81B
MSVYTPPAAATAQQPSAGQSQPWSPQQQNVLASLPQLATLLSAAPTGAQAPGQQMQPQGFSLPFNPNDIVNAVNTAAGVVNQLAQIGHGVGLFSASPAGQPAQGQMTPQGFDIGDALSTFAKLAPILLSASPTGQPGQGQTGQPAQGQMTPQGFDIGDALSTFAKLAPILLSA